MTARLTPHRAKVTGRLDRDPKRFAGRSEIIGEPLGPPPAHLTATGKAAWKLFAVELPWLTRSDRALVELAAVLRGKLMASEPLAITAMSLMQTILSKLGASPCDRSRVTAVPDERVPDEFFGLN